MLGISTGKIASAAAVLLLFGAVRLPLERHMDGELREQQFLDDNVDVPMLDQLGQGGFAAVLGGFRSLVASYYYLKSHIDGFDRNQWEKVDQQYGLITTLQPRSGHYWDQYIWHMGWNAYAHTMRDAEYEKRHGSAWKGSNLETFTAPGYLDRAEEVALKSVTQVHDDYRLYQRVAMFYDEKRDDKCQSAEWFLRGSQVEGAPRYMHKIYANFLAQCPGAEEVAYPLIRARYWDGDPRERSLSVLVHMEDLEDTLARRELEREGPDGLRSLIAAEPDNYLHHAALAIHYAEDLKQPEKAMDIYQTMISREGAEVPEFYKKKWAMLAAGVPGREHLAYAALRKILEKTRRRLTPEEEALVRPLEEKLQIPMELRVFGGKKSVKPRSRFIQ